MRNLSVSKYIIVDDDFDIKSVTLKMSQIGPIAKMIELELDDDDSEDDSWERVLDVLNNDYEKLYKVGQQPQFRNPGVVSGAKKVLEETFGKERVQAVGPRIHSEIRDFIADEVKRAEGDCVLVFDEDLAESGSGLDLAQAFSSMDKVLATIVITHHIRTEEEETERERGELETTNITFLAKARLSEPNVLLLKLRRAIVSRRFGEIREIVGMQIRENANSAVESLNLMKVDEFDWILGHGAHEEGAWIADDIARIVGGIQRTGLMMAMRKNPQLHSLSARISELYGDQKLIRPRKRALGYDDVVRSAFGYTAQERYLTKEFGGLHLGTDAGDIFQVEDGNYWILVEQKCDIMVRADGQRNKDKDGDRHVLVCLVKIVPRKAREDAGPQEGETGLAVVPDDGLSYVLPNFLGRGDGCEYIVQYSKHMYVPGWVLDLAVFRADGECRIDAVQACPSGPTPSWVRRFGLVREYAVKVAEAQPEYRSDVARLPRGQTVHCEPSADGDKWNLQFQFKRIGRLFSPFAEELVQRKAAHLSRWPHQRDLARFTRR